MPNSSLLTLISRVTFGLCVWLLLRDASAGDLLEIRGPWAKSSQGGIYETFTIHGTGDRNNPIRSCSRRRVSTVSLQPLFLLNSEFMNSMAGELAERVRATEMPRSGHAEIALGLVLGRQPDQEELLRAEQFLADNSLESFCQSLLNLNEFLYIN